MNRRRLSMPMFHANHEIGAEGATIRQIFAPLCLIRRRLLYKLLQFVEQVVAPR
jgi:hypothetical protein